VPCRNETEQSILDAAIALFGNRGRNAVSIAEIANTAGVNRALIFYYFGSKDGLYRAAFLSLFEEFAGTVASKILPIEPGIGKVERLVREHIAYIRSHPALVRFIVRELLQADNSVLLPEIITIMGPFRDMMLEALIEGTANGEIRDVDLRQTMVNVLSLSVFFFLGKPLIRLFLDDINLTRFEREREDHVIDLLMHGLKTQGV